MSCARISIRGRRGGDVDCSQYLLFQARETLCHLPGVGFADDPVSYNRKMMQVMLNGLLPAKE